MKEKVKNLAYHMFGANTESDKEQLLILLGKNKFSFIYLILSLLGYIVLVVMGASKPVLQTDYSPVLPMMLSLTLYLFSAVYFFDTLTSYVSQKAPYIYLIFNSHNKSNCAQDISYERNFVIFSIIYRLFSYTGIFSGALTLALIFLKIYSREFLLNILLSGVLFSLLYESYRSILFILSNLLNALLGNKRSLIFVKIVNYTFMAFLLVVFMIKFLPNMNFMGGFGNVYNLSMWEIVPISRWTFDLIYIAIKQYVGITHIFIIVQFIIIETVLYLFWGNMKKLIFRRN